MGNGKEGIMGLQFENLVVHNRKTLWKMYGVEESVLDERYFDKVINFGQLLE